MFYTSIKMLSPNKVTISGTELRLQPKNWGGKGRDTQFSSYY